MQSIGGKTRARVQGVLLFLGVVASLWLFIHLLRSQIYGPLALVACGTTMLGFCVAGLAFNPPPSGIARQIAWGGIGFFAAGIAVGATVMHWEVSGR